MNRLERMLKDFDENQLREINKFLNSADGRRLKSQKRISGLSTADLMKIMKNL